MRRWPLLELSIDSRRPYDLCVQDDLSQLATAVGPTKEEWELCFEYYSQGAEELEAEASLGAFGTPRIMKKLEGFARNKRLLEIFSRVVKATAHAESMDDLEQFISLRLSSRRRI